MVASGCERRAPGRAPAPDRPRAGGADAAGVRAALLRRGEPRAGDRHRRPRAVGARARPRHRGARGRRIRERASRGALEQAARAGTRAGRGRRPLRLRARRGARSRARAPADVDATAARAPATRRDGRRSCTAPSGRALEVVVARGRRCAVVTRVRVDDASGRGAPLVRLVALYMITFALALLVFAYFALTRLIVRPVERLVDAADRVASGARTLRVPRTGARELVELGASVQAMAEKLIAEEATLLLKVEELTETTDAPDGDAGPARPQRAHGERRPARRGRRARDRQPDRGAHGHGGAAARRRPRRRRRSATSSQRMRRETERIHTVLRDLLDFARPEGPREPRRAAASPADVRARRRRRRWRSCGRRSAFRDVPVDVDVDGALHVALPGAAPHAGAAQPRAQRGRGRRAPASPRRDASPCARGAEGDRASASRSRTTARASIPARRATASSSRS